MKKRKPRLNYGMGCMMPYRYVTIKIVSVEKIGADTYDVGYAYAKEDYYHDVYGDEVFHQETRCSSKPYRVGKKYVWPMCIDLD